MRLADWTDHPAAHAGLTGVGVDDHHRGPTPLSASNNSLSVPPLPGGPGVWDIAVPFDTLAVIFHFKSSRVVELAGASAGVTGVATRDQFDTSTVSLGGHSTISSGAYNAVYSKAAAALYLSHKVFSSGGADIALTEAYLVQTGPSSRVLRTTWTNFSAGLRTLDVEAEMGLL